MPEEERVKIVKTNYPSNSNTRKQAVGGSKSEKVVERVTTNEVVQRKKPLGRKLVESFTGDDVGSVGHYILMEVLLPAAKTMISDAASQGVERLLFGDSRPRAGNTRVGGGYTSYNRMYGGSTRRDEPRTISRTARATHDFGEVILQTRGEAEDVLDRLSALVEQYDVATVSDLYELVGITGAFTDDKWGWADLRGSSIRRIRDGYLVELPRPTPID